MALIRYMSIKPRSVALCRRRNGEAAARACDCAAPDRLAGGDIASRPEADR